MHDGHGSVRALTNPSGAITDTYDYDAFGNLLRKTGTTANNYLFADEQFDPNLNLYYNRARYLSTATGRFWTMDSFDGDPQSPLSLHKYLYTEDDPVDNTDPTGHEIDEIGAMALGGVLDSMTSLNFTSVVNAVKNTIRDDPKDLWLVPDADIQRQGVTPSFWQKGKIPQRNILYLLERKDGKPLENPSYNWTVSEHQTVPVFARSPYGTSSGTLSGRFCDEISPLFSKIPNVSGSDVYDFAAGG